MSEHMDFKPKHQTNHAEGYKRYMWSKCQATLNGVKAENECASNPGDERNYQDYVKWMEVPEDFDYRGRWLVEKSPTVPACYQRCGPG